MPEVTALHGGEVIRPVPNENCVAHARKLLEQAEAGEVTGFVVAKLHGDGLGSYTIAGLAGPYSLLGALDMGKAELQELMRGQFE